MIIGICEGVSGVLNYTPSYWDSPEYQRVHALVRKLYGPAIEYICIQCSCSAQVWAWQHGEDPSLPSSYQPMCVWCHRYYDNTQQWRENISLGQIGNNKGQGINNGSAKLSEKDVLEIRSLYSTGNFSQTNLANIYDVNQSRISSIVTRRTWRHI
jgi:hypothetical protein